MDNNNNNPIIAETIAELVATVDEMTQKRDRVIMWHEALRAHNEVDAEMDVYIIRDEDVPQRLKTISKFWSNIMYDEEYQRAVFYNGTDNDRDIFEEWMLGHEDGYWNEQREMMATNDDDGDDDAIAGTPAERSAQFYEAVNVARAAGRLECAEDLLQEGSEFMERLRRARYGRATLIQQGRSLADDEEVIRVTSADEFFDALRAVIILDYTTSK